MQKIQIGIASPTYNEAENINYFIESILTLKEIYIINICFVDDESQDNTLKIIQSYKKEFNNINIIKRKKLKSTQVYSAYHNGLKWLYDNTKSEYFAQIDSDNVCDISVIKQAFENLTLYKNIDLVKLSKYKNNNKDERSFIRRYLSKIYTAICKFLYKEISDYSTGIRFYNSYLVNKLIERKRKFSSPIGLLDDLLWIINNNFKIQEISFKINDRKFGKSFFKISLLISLGIQFIYCIFLNKINND